MASEAIKKWLIKHSFSNSIFMLQETHSTALVEQKWRSQWRGKMFFSHGTSNSTGVLNCITEDLDCKVKNELHDKNDRLLILDIEIQSEHYVIINYYGNNDQHGQLETLPVLESLLDKINFKLDAPSLKTNSLNKISILLSDHDLCDIFRVRFPDTQRFSWGQKNPLIKRRLDYFFISNEIQDDVAFIDIVLSVASDQSGVHLKISGSKTKSKDRSYWKFNNSLVEGAIYVEKVKSLINTVKAEMKDIVDLRVQWEFLKYKIRQFTG